MRKVRLFVAIVACASFVALALDQGVESFAMSLFVFLLYLVDRNPAVAFGISLVAAILPLATSWFRHWRARSGATRPRVSQALLGLLVRNETAEGFQLSVEETFDANVERVGVREARRKYRRAVRWFVIRMILRWIFRELFVELIRRILG